ncbi:MAG: ABC transporter substrate-binding protein [Lewinella sp.]|nr:ABC transporter substrate-binding protein [Lewinella sp.]
MRPTFRDQLGRPIHLPVFPPRRIVSLVPSQTELLADLGLERETVGITKFCVHPDHWFRAKTRVGGTKKLHPERILALHPDLVIANKEENDPAQIWPLAARVPVWVSDVPDFAAALRMISGVGEVTGRSAAATRLISELVTDESGLAGADRPRVLYLIWREPFMAAGGDTFIHDMLERAGFRNVLADQRRYPQLSPAEIAALRPDLILLSSEPFPFKAIHQAELRRLCPDARVPLVNGEYFSWYGSRLRQASAYLRSLRQKLGLR